MASMWPPKKNTEFKLYFTLYTNAGAVVASPALPFVQQTSKDGDARTTIAATITKEDTTYGQCSVVLSATEMNGDAIWVYITDATSTTVPFTCTLYTSAFTLDEIGAAVITNATGADVATDVAGLVTSMAALATTADIADAVLDETVTSHTGAIADIHTKTGYLPSATAGAPNGLVICGTNAAVTITSATADALTLSATGANKSGLKVAGNGSAAGVDIDAGATGIGVSIAGGSASGNGVTVSSTVGAGMELISSDGNGLKATGGDASGAYFIGNLTGAGLRLAGGATGNGLTVTGGATSGHGAYISTTDGDGIEIASAGAGHADIDASIVGDITGTLSTVTLCTTCTTNTDLAAVASAVGDVPTAIENADALLARDIGSTTGAGTLNERTVRAALRILRNKLVIGTSDMTVYKEDDAATAWVATLTTNAAAEPISTIDPS